MTINVKLDGVQKFSADDFAGVNGPDWLFTTHTPPPPTGCVADPLRTRMTAVTAGYNGIRNSPQRTADATSLLSVFGWDAEHNRPTDPALFPWGVDGIGVVLAIPRGRYLSLRVHTPPQSFKTGKWQGTLAFESNLSQGNGNPRFNVAISRQCNDFATPFFAGKMPNGSLDVDSDGQPHMKFTQGLQPNDIPPDSDVFLNIRFADPAVGWNTCFLTWRMSTRP